MKVPNFKRFNFRYLKNFLLFFGRAQVNIAKRSIGHNSYGLVHESLEGINHRLRGVTPDKYPITNVGVNKSMIDIF